MAEKFDHKFKPEFDEMDPNQFIVEKAELVCHLYRVRRGSVLLRQLVGSVFAIYQHLNERKKVICYPFDDYTYSLYMKL